MLFIDHHKKLYKSDLQLVEKAGLLRTVRSPRAIYSSGGRACVHDIALQGSVVVADNVITPGVPDYLEYVRSHPNFTSVLHESKLEYSDEKDGVEVSTYTSA